MAASESGVAGPLLVGGVSLVVGGALSTLFILVGVNQLEPSVSQSDAPLIVYGSTS